MLVRQEGFFVVVLFSIVLCVRQVAGDVDAMKSNVRLRLLLLCIKSD